jgi:diguanylate cyclase (GGDEF)-like protein
MPSGLLSHLPAAGTPEQPAANADTNTNNGRTAKRPTAKAEIGRHRRAEVPEAGAGSPRNHAVKMLTFLLIVAIFAVPTVLTLNLKHAGEKGIESQVQLSALTTDVHILDGIGRRLINGEITWKAALAGISVAHPRAHLHLAQAGALGLPKGPSDSIEGALHHYYLELDQEVKLLSMGGKQAAVQQDRTKVAPAFAAVTGLLERQSLQMEKGAKAAQREGDIGLLLTVLLSLMLISLVQSVRRRATVLNKAKRQSDARYRALIDQSSDLVAVVDRRGHATYYSPSVERRLRPQPSDNLRSAPVEAGARELNFLAAIDPSDRERFATTLQAAVPGRMEAGEFRLSGLDGVSVFEMTMQDLSADPSVGGVVLTGHDVTERLALQREIEHRALHDTLTGLPNRALLADRFEHALRGSRRGGGSTGLLLLDLDRFKEVNDTFGHHYGDELLRQIGPRLTGVLRSVDTIARLGGDEFAVLLPAVSGVDEALAVAGALLAALAVPFPVEGVEMQVEASIGVAISGQHGEDAIILMQRADIAMYVAKTQHVGVFAYDPDVDANSAGKLALVWDLRRALDRGELVMHYQGKVNVKTGLLVGAEALVRWEHPDMGLILPDDFIPLAERTGLINPLTQYVIDAALTQARLWLDAGRPLPVSVNLSARNLHDERFADQVAGLLAKHGVPPHLLELEVTESAIIIDPQRALAMLHELSALGMRISLDDFGAGYTSLSQLTSMPISEIKIDRSFVMKMAEDPNSALIVSSVVELGHNLGMTLVAEGVEDEVSLGALGRLGCDVAQGYHLTRPIPATDFDLWRAERAVAPAQAYAL